MGTIISACQKGDSEEETITRIFSRMSLHEIEAKSAYAEFLRCINPDEHFLDYFLFKSFLAQIIGENTFKEAQLTYFENMRKLDKENLNQRRIGGAIIFLAKGSMEEKITILAKHFEKFYGAFNEKNVKEFINDFIEINTENCILSFRDNLGYECVKNLSSLWNKARRQKLLNRVYQNYESINSRQIYCSKPNSSSSVSSIRSIRSCETIDTNCFDQSFEAERRNEEFEAKMQSVIDIVRPTDRFTCVPLGRPYGVDYSDDCLPKTEHSKIEGAKIRKRIKEFIELSFCQLEGDQMRSWLYDDYIKERSEEEIVTN